ncbi:MAG: fructose-1,6-bisphosphatase [Candidatus Lokiarchaeota archaeon]|nr:fructose-1,6-bisphosphatase [Candidatus Lokiarchaeota archaeon]
MTHWREPLVRIARGAGDAIKPVLGTAEAGLDEGSGAGGDVTKRVDALAEDCIVDAFRRAGRPMRIITEERGVVFVNGGGQDGEVGLVAIVDPVDGSFNATRNLPFFAVSIAIADGPLVRDITDAVVLNVSTGDVFSASRGEGAWLNGRPASVNRAAASLAGAAMGVDVNPKRGEFRRVALIDQYSELLDAPMKIRVLGSNALEACLVASGALDCFVDVRGNLRLFDIAAAWLIVREAGGGVYELRDGEAIDMGGRELSIEGRLAVLAVASTALKDETATLVRKGLNKPGTRM